MHQRRVVVTGMGIVSCFGMDVEHFYAQLLEGKSGITPLQAFPCEEYPTRFAGSVQGFDIGDYIDKKQARRVDPFVQYAMVAGKKALEMSKAHPDPRRAGILIGSGMGGMHAFSDGVETLITKGFRRLTPFFVPYIITNIAGALLAIDLGFMGPNYSVSTACATGSHAIYLAAEHIRRGDADLMICGGSEAGITPIGLAGFVACKALSERNDDPTKASRPWDRDRDGFVLGEGAGVLVLELLDHALARKAPILAEYLGGAVSCDAYHMTAPHPEGLGVRYCIEQALKDAHLAKERVGYINAHATSTPLGDLFEIQAIRDVFGDHVHHLAINATKSMIGHSLGAAGGIEAIVAVQALMTGKLHPSINLDNPEPVVADLNLVRNIAQSCTIEAALSNSFGFGGHNASLLFGRYAS